jgi:hypothetical protein
MRRLALIGVLLALAACGIDGAPTPPGGGLDTGGEARIGVVGEL